ncbi:MAG: twin-arginine translocase subunit TatC [Opitutales bacterium]
MSNERESAPQADEPTGRKDRSRHEDAMSFLEHLEEFRWTVGRSLLAFVLGIGLVAVFIQDIATFLQMPLVRAYGSTDTALENLITYRPMGVFSVFLQIAFLGGLTLSMPFIFYFLAAFVAPGLTERERSVVRPSCVAAFLLFLTGVSFAFFVLLPLTLSVSVRVNAFFNFSLFWAATEYYNMVVWFSVATGAFFQFPLILVVLIYLEVLPVAKLRSLRRVVFVGLLVFAAFLTPGGDFVTLPMTGGALYALYELAILAGARIERKNRDREWAEWDDGESADD